ncbi:MFS transporter, partial [Shewanella sp.]|nr:MFS transporter [Shewanella sp.]
IPVEISWATVFLTACMIFTSIWVNPIIQRIMSHANAGLIGVILFGSALMALPFIDNQFYLISFALMGVGIAIYNGFLPVYLSNAYQNNPQGQLMGMLVTVFCLGNLLAAGIGSLLSLLDVKWALLCGAFVSYSAAAIFFHGHYKVKLWQQ